jgi:uncharacterized membrane protein
MKLTLKNFDTVEDNEATERGLQYYRDGAISYIEEIEEDEWEASVMGTELYSVAINLVKSKINATGCDCRAFSKDNYCKHVAAVLFAIRDQVAKEEPKPKNKKTKTKTQNQILQEVLKLIEEKHLKAFIENYASHHKDFANDVLLYFKLQSVVNDPTEEGFIQVVQNAADNSRVKSDIDTELLSKNLRPVISQAQKYVNDSNYLEAFYIIKAIINVLAPLLNSLSYTWRQNVNAITQAIDLLESISGFGIPPMFRDDLFDYSLSLSERHEFISSEYDKRIDQLLPRLANDSRRKDAILSLMARKMQMVISPGTHLVNTSKLGKHLSYLNYSINLLQDLNRAPEADALIRANLYYHDELRHIEIRKAITKGDSPYARQLIEEKLSGKTVKVDSYYNHEKEKEKWLPYYLDIAILDKDTAGIVSYAESLFKSTYDIRFYNILKQFYPKDKWHKKFEEIELSLFRKHYSFGILATIYIQEGKTKDLFELLKKHAFLGNIHDTLPVLLPVYGPEVLVLYNKALISMLQHGTVVSYKETADHLNYLLSLGQKETVQNWIETFKSIYSNRPRLLKELGKVQI